MNIFFMNKYIFLNEYTSLKVNKYIISLKLKLHKYVFAGCKMMP